MLDPAVLGLMMNQGKPDFAQATLGLAGLGIADGVAVDNGHDFALVLDCCVVFCLEHKMLIGGVGQVGAGKVAFASFDNGDESATLAWIFCLRVLQDLGFQRFTDDHLPRPAPGKLPNGNSDSPVIKFLNLRLQLDIRLPHWSARSTAPDAL